MSNDKFAISLQQDLLTVLVHDPKNGRVVSKTVDATLFEGDYRTIADRALTFWSQHNTAPKQHIVDLLADILEDKHDRRGQTYRRILLQMQEVQDQINVDFVLRSMDDFIWVQKSKGMLLHTAELLDAKGVHGKSEVEKLFREFVREQNVVFDPGLRLNDIDKVLDYFSSVHAEFSTGIRDLDEGHIVPMRGKLMLFLAPSGYGKTWFLVQLGKMAFIQRKKVLHISLEIESEEVLQRYYQALFGASKRDDKIRVSALKKDMHGDLDQIVQTDINVNFTFESEAIKEELQTRIEHFGNRASNFIIKRFPMRSLTVDMLEAYLESLEVTEEFVPDLVVLDYPGIMKTDEKNHRISLGRLIENLRGLAQRRNFALAAAHQSNRSSVEADMVKVTHVGEDWSAIATSDFIVTYSQTMAENKMGLARLYVAKGRSEQDKFGILITQNYRTGQFVLESVRLSDSYAQMMEQMGTADEPNTDDD